MTSFGEAVDVCTDNVYLWKNAVRYVSILDNEIGERNVECTYSEAVTV